GPLILMFVGLTAATLYIIDRSLRWVAALQPLPGLAWFALLGLPWFVAIPPRSGDTFLVESFGKDLLAKLVSSQEGHGAPPGFYSLLFFFTFWRGARLASSDRRRVLCVRSA